MNSHGQHQEITNSKIVKEHTTTNTTDHGEAGNKTATQKHEKSIS